jgi:hypothetical protein
MRLLCFVCWLVYCCSMKHHQVNVGVQPRLFVCELWFNHSLDFRKLYISDFLLQLHKEWGGTTGLESCSPSPAASISDQLFSMPFRVRSKVVYWSNTNISKLVHILTEMKICSGDAYGSMLSSIAWIAFNWSSLAFQAFYCIKSVFCVWIFQFLFDGGDAVSRWFT